MEQTQNTFNGGLNVDITDFILPNDTLRNCQNMRIINLDGLTFAATNLPGNTNELDPNGAIFQISDRFIPFAAKEYNGVLYILSLDFTNMNEVGFEIGSYPSPNYANPADINDNIWVYRPFNNLDAGAFTTIDLFSPDITNPESFIDLELQYKYDNTVNAIFTSRGVQPQLINTGFTYIDGKFELSTLVSYTSINLASQVKLIPPAPIPPKIDLIEITTGGRLKPGNYQYFFAFVDENFNETDIIAKSNTCAVTFIDGIKGGTELEYTNRAVKLEVANVITINTPFKYLRVYFQFNSGVDSKYKALFKIENLVDLEDTIQFIHTGYENTLEISFEQLNTTYSVIDSAATLTQVKNYLMLGDITQTLYDWEKLKVATKEISVGYKHTAVSDGYDNPLVVYYEMSEMRGETVPFGIVYLMKDGTLSPVFPISGYDYVTDTQPADMLEKGLIRFPELSVAKLTDPSGPIYKLGLTLDFTTIVTDTAYLLENTIGWKLVRGDRVPDALAQGYLIPTFRVPVVEEFPAYTFAYDNNSATEDDFKFVPCLDSIVEAFAYEDINGSNNVRYYVGTAGDNSTIEDGYMICTVVDNYIGRFNDATNEGEGAGFKIFDETRWAFYSSDAILNQSEYITYLNRDSLYIKQYGRVIFNAGWTPGTQFVPADNPGGVYEGPEQISGLTGLRYSFSDIIEYATTVVVTTKADIFTFIPAETGAVIDDFGAKAVTSMRDDLFNDSGDNQVAENWTKKYDIHQHYNSYFGVKVSGLENARPGKEHPIGCASQQSDGSVVPGRATNGEVRTGENTDDLRNQISGLTYLNDDPAADPIYGAFIVNVYPSDTGLIADPSLLYPSLNSIIYRQVWDSILWAGAIDTIIDIFGGDTYIGELTTKLSQAGPDYRDNHVPDVDNDLRRGIDSGILMDMVQETQYNPYMRAPYIKDVTESEKRTFYPYRKNTQDVNIYREYRYPDTEKVTIGSNELYGEKACFTLLENSPFLKFEYFTRIMHSSRNIPNSLVNGYKLFRGLNYRDYDTIGGRIIRIEEFRDTLIIIFEHAVAVASIEERIMTGSDTTGSIFVESKEVLSPNISFYTKILGTQFPNSVIRTPGALYGFDVYKGKIWQITDSFKAISDNGFSSFMAKNITNTINATVVTGYNPRYAEVYFTYVGSTDNRWTLVYKEGLEKFVFFFTGRPKFYANRENSFYSFGGEVNVKPDRFAFEHDNFENKLIYGNLEDSYVEFVINVMPNETKVIDYLKLVSSEVAPSLIELFTYDVNAVKDLNPIDTSLTFQYIKIVQGIDMFKEEPVFKLRGRQYVVQIPEVQIQKKDELEHWDIDSRLRNKVIIVRVTYNTTKNTELVSVITNYRRSIS